MEIDSNWGQRRNGIGISEPKVNQWSRNQIDDLRSILVVFQIIGTRLESPISPIHWAVLMRAFRKRHLRRRIVIYSYNFNAEREHTERRRNLSTLEAME